MWGVFDVCLFMLCNKNLDICSEHLKISELILHKPEDHTVVKFAGVQAEGEGCEEDVLVILFCSTYHHLHCTAPGNHIL